MAANRYYLTREDYLLHHGILGQKWGKRNGPPYPLGADKLAHEIYLSAIDQEPKITKDVVYAANKVGSEMHGLTHKIKTEESILRKINVDSKEKKITPYKAAKDIKDSVRYTILSKDKNFVQNYKNIKADLESKGYKETRCRNYWDLYKKGLAKHKSVQSVFKTPDGYIFEIQFQTPSSQKAKDLKVPLYEERRKNNVDQKRNAELERRMDELAKTVLTPINIYEIKSH